MLKHEFYHAFANTPLSDRLIEKDGMNLNQIYESLKYMEKENEAQDCAGRYAAKKYISAREQSLLTQAEEIFKIIKK